MAKKTTQDQRVIIDDEVEPGVNTAATEAKATPVNMNSLTKAQLIDICGQMQAQLQANQEYINQCNEFAAKWDNLVSDFNTVQQENVVLKKDIADVTQQKNSVSDELNELSVRYSQKEEECARLQDELNDIRRQLNEYHNLDTSKEIENLNKVVKVITTKYDNLKTLYADEIMFCDSIKAALRELKEITNK